MNNIDMHLDEYGRLNFASLYKAAEEAQQKETEELAKQQARQKALVEAKLKEEQELMRKCAESIARENRLKAERQIEEETITAKAELEARIKRENNLKSDEDINMDKSYSRLLEDLRFDD